MAETTDFEPGALNDEILAGIRGEPDPGFAERLRGELRGRQARATGNLWWFDVELPVGSIRIVHDEQLIHMVDNDMRRYEFRAKQELGFMPAQGESPRLREAAQRVFAGEKRGSDIVFLGELTRFQQAVLRATSRIPRGAVRPYAWVAREAGSAGAVRAAGTTLAHNPVPFIVPCHRVVHTDWSLGKYSAGGPGVKYSVLEMEGMTPGRLAWIQSAPRFIGQLDSMAFCLPACTGVELEEPSNLRGFKTPEEAIEAGFSPCEDCRPV